MGSRDVVILAHSSVRASGELRLPGAAFEGRLPGAAGFDEAAEPALKALAYRYRRPAP